LQHFCEIHDKQNFAICSVSVHRSDILPFAKFNDTHKIATFTIHRVSLQTLRSTTHRNLRYLAPRILRFNMYRKPHHKFLQNFLVVDVSQVAMWVSSQSSERVTGEGSFTKGFRNVIWFSKRDKKIKNLLDQMEAINPLNHYYNLYCLGRLSENINKVHIAVLLFLKIKLHNGAE
jgi:hypothetical protein